MRRRTPLLLGAIGLVAVLGAAAWWFVIRDDAPEELGLTETSQPEGGSSGSTPTSLDGTWEVVRQEATTAGFRIKETFVSGVADHTAVGRTTDVTGSFAIEWEAVTEGSFTVGLDGLEFTDDPPGLDVANRKRALQDRGLEISRFPEASFALTSPVEIGEVPEPGTTLALEATGELTLHGVTREVTIPIDAQLVDDQIEVVTREPVPVRLADYEMEPPTAGPVAEVEDTGSFEFRVRLARS